MERIMITISGELLKNIDLVKSQLNQNRSQFIRYAITEYLKQIKEKEFEELMAKGYMVSSEEDSAIVKDIMGVQAIVAEKVWGKDG
jgi:metal-responsive CopG/Arc/MetJ family transcriptional regulator